MDGKSLNLTDEKLQKLKEILPEVFTEKKVDWEKLKASLGENIEFKNERYVLNWAGKSDSFRVLQSPSTSTLVPAKDESVNFDETENIFIEGENLEVLKVLQKSYFGKIKMIYIDPPYNTGNDNFIYPDKFSETREEYLSRIGDKDETGNLTREGLFRKNSKDSGHYHSSWLSMMYPRLFLARNLLKDDGVIFVSIDDNEVHNLRLLMNEVFGEENFVGQIIWRKRAGRSNDAKLMNNVAEYLLLYRKSIKVYELREPRSEKSNKDYKNSDNDSRGLWTSISYVSQRTKEQRPNLCYEIVNPNTNEKIKHPTNSWKYSFDQYKKFVDENRLYWGINGKHKYPRLKVFLSELKSGLVPINFWDFSDSGSIDAGTKELNSILGPNLFPYPKPIDLIKKAMYLGMDKSDIILDFFLGSGSTSQAVYNLNKQDNGNRKFICVQLPEKCDDNSEAYKAGYETIAEIGKERIRRVIKKIKDEKEATPPSLPFEGEEKNGELDLGFKVFKLQESNFKIWRTNIENEEELVKQLQLHTEPLDENTKTENILYEFLLKSGVPLTAKIEEKEDFYFVKDYKIVLILEKIEKETVKKVIEEKPKIVITLDRLFKNNDQLKTNTILQMKDAEIEFKVV